ncbi:MAG: nucleic acid-binding protein [Alteromonadaceae bacterium]|nr:MAG: nucleic acid-binding protein [Alteromonadaceae bacterium]
MSERTILKRLPNRLEPRKLAYSDTSFEGSVSADEVPRLLEATRSISNVKALLRFFVDDRKNCVINGSVSADVVLECQRCLQALEPRQITAAVMVAVVNDEAKAEQLPKDLDPWILEEPEADLYLLIEEELLLSLPVVSYHKDECLDPSLYSTGDIEAETIVKRSNPFDVLASIKGKNEID